MIMILCTILLSQNPTKTYNDNAQSGKINLHPSFGNGHYSCIRLISTSKKMRQCHVRLQSKMLFWLRFIANQPRFLRVQNKRYPIPYKRDFFCLLLGEVMFAKKSAVRWVRFEIFLKCVLLYLLLFYYVFLCYYII